jgi:hypothetical protein
MHGALLLLWPLLGFAAQGLAAQGDRPAEFSSLPPEGVDDVSQWEVMSGEFATAQAVGAYRFYVSSGHSALYRLMRYRVSFLAASTEAERRNWPTEKLVWNAHPGARVPLLCWERVEAIGSAPAHWRELNPGSPEYVAEMRVLIRVLYLRRATGPGERGEGEP